MSWPNTLPVFRSRKCNLVQAGQIMPSYSFSRTSSSSSSQCWTRIDVSGQVKMKAAIGLDAALGLLGFDLAQKTKTSLAKLQQLLTRCLPWQISAFAKNREVPDFVGAPDTIRTCDLCLRRAKARGGHDQGASSSNGHHQRMRDNGMILSPLRANAVIWSAHHCIILRRSGIHSAAL